MSWFDKGVEFNKALERIMKPRIVARSSRGKSS